MRAYGRAQRDFGERFQQGTGHPGTMMSTGALWVAAAATLIYIGEKGRVRLATRQQEQTASDLWAAGYRAAIENQGETTCPKNCQHRPEPAARRGNLSVLASSPPAYSQS